MDHIKITEQEMLDSLVRSGYLLESEITKYLIKSGYFVEPNITSLDPLTGKSREIDLLAEYDRDFTDERQKNKIAVLTRFIFEIKNNNAPLVLMTRYESSPHSEIYNGLKVAETYPNGLTDIFHWGFYNVLFQDENKSLFSQYCSFSKKRNEELMAHHPDNIYSSLQKITYYCEEVVKKFNDRGIDRDEYYRNFLYLPVLLINEDLYELEISESNDKELKKVSYSRLVFNYHYQQDATTAIVYVVTKAGLKDFLTEIHDAEQVVEKNMIEAKRKASKKVKS